MLSDVTIINVNEGRGNIVHFASLHGLQPNMLQDHVSKSSIVVLHRTIVSECLKLSGFYYVVNNSTVRYRTIVNSLILTQSRINEIATVQSNSFEKCTIHKHI